MTYDNGNGPKSAREVFGGSNTDLAADVQVLGDWPPELLRLTEEEAHSLSIISLRVQHSKVRGGKASTTNKKKTGVVTAHWKRLSVRRGLTDNAKAAFEWLISNNDIYRNYFDQHETILKQTNKAKDWFVIKTATLLLQMKGVEVAARPWLYPIKEYCDTDLKPRLVLLSQISEKQLPSIKASWRRKMLSDCVSYEEDFELFSLLYDIHLAQQLSSIIAIADKHKMSPEELASTNSGYDSYWYKEAEKQQDMCRQMQAHPSFKGQSGMPNCFVTIAPAKWKFDWHKGLHEWRKGSGESLSDAQASFTIHMHHVIGTILREVILKKGVVDDNSSQELKDRKAAGIEEVYEFAFRWEYQGRGTLHVHIIAWIKLNDDIFACQPPVGFESPSTQLNGNSVKMPSNPILYDYLNRIFNASIDVQCGSGSAGLLKYVTGYVSKASDALTFKQKAYLDKDSTTWRQVYRLLTKRAPLCPEMAVDFAGLPLMEASFRGATIHAPVPKIESLRPDADKNNDRAMYEAYLRHQQSIAAFSVQDRYSGAPAVGRVCFLDWARQNTVIKKNERGQDKVVFDVKKRGGHGVGKNKEKCALGIRFPYEGLDIFIGAWCATMVPHISEDEFAPAEDDAIPEFGKYLQTVLSHPYYKGDLTMLLDQIDADFVLRGLPGDRRKTFRSRIQAMKLLLDNTGRNGMCIPANIWNQRRIAQRPGQMWCDGQREVLGVVQKGVAVDDANVDAHSRLLLVTGKPGSGKTEAVIGCAIAAAERGERVLIACPIGALVDVYRQRLPANENIVVETVHSSHRITRVADEQYIPPGRLRHFDLIIYDEVSQLQSDVWRKVRTAIVELNPHPFVMLVGDFQQLQPAFGEAELKNTIDIMLEQGQLRHIELELHAMARSTDPTLLDFLHEIRQEQPSKSRIAEFFSGRRLAADKNCKKDHHIAEAVQDSIDIEKRNGVPFTFLTVTNQGAKIINHTRCALEFGNHERIQNWQRHVVAGDPALAGDCVVVVGMRVRLTHNVDKERGFVNGTLAEVEYLLSDNVFIAKTKAGLRLLVHPITYNKDTYIPFSYGYALTIRRSQGSGLDQGALWFDHCFPADPGYAYVGASRFKRACDIMLMGKVRVTDWIPVGAVEESAQLKRGADSEDTRSEEGLGSEDPGSCTESDEEAAGSDPAGDDMSEGDVEDEGNDPGGEQSSEDGDTGNDPAPSSDESSNEERDEAKDCEAEMEEAAEAAMNIQIVPRMLTLRPNTTAPAYALGAVEAVKAWHKTEGILGPYKQLQFK